MADTFAKATAIGGPPVSVVAFALPCPAGPCFPDLDSREFQSVAPDLFSPRAHARVCGYDTFWMAEHHFQPEGTELIPNLLMMAMHLCGVTRNIKIGCGLNIVPMWHPLRLAEDYAMADILTGGRVIFGVGRGYHTREVETFGAPLVDQNANREMFEEGVEILFKAFEGKPFSHQGKYLRDPARGAVSRLHPQGDHLGAGAGAAAGRMLAADPERLRARLRFHGEIRCREPPTGWSAVTSRLR
jgi:hypothetical protein